MTKAIVYPILTGDDWLNPEPPLPLERDSKAAAIRALRDEGYRIIWSGGLFDVLTTSAQELCCGRGDNPRVISRERAIGSQLPEDAEITKYVVSVWPTKD
jgi:hypothetical protein